MKFDVLLIDPPWTFQTFSDKGKGKSAENHYDCMTLEDIANLPISSIASDNSIMFLWTTGPMLEATFPIITRWGFKYQTIGFCWAKQCKKQNDKDHFGMGYYTRSNVELCLIATRGKPKRVSASVRQLQRLPVEEHSKKPDKFRELIVELMGDIPRVELFARQECEGWVSLGLEVGSRQDLRDSLPELADR